jgi:hypothetical protein
VNSETSGGGLPARRRYPSGTLQWMPWYLVCVAVVFIVFASLLVRESRGGHRPLVFVFGVVTGSGAIALLVVAALMAQRLTVTSEVLRIPRAFGSIVIPLSAIAGVGLVFRRTIPPTRMPSGWYLTVWRVDGSSERTGVSFLPTKFHSEPGANGRDWRLNPTMFDAVAHTDFDRLAATPAATVAQDIYARAIAVQGPTGALATLGLQKRATYDQWSISPITAFWSPDGQVGYALGLRS